MVIDPTPETIIEEQLKKDYGENNINISLSIPPPLRKFEKRPDFFSPSPVKTYTNNLTTISRKK